MVQTIKDLWQDWKSLKTWQQVVFVLPYIILFILLIIYMISPIKSKKLDKEIIEHGKKASNDHLKTIEKEDKKLKKKQEKLASRRKEIERRIGDKSNEASSIIKDIERADDNLNELIDLHKRLNSRK